VTERIYQSVYTAYYYRLDWQRNIDQ